MNTFTIHHNHVARDIKERGECPGCDKVWDSYERGREEEDHHVSPDLATLKASLNQTPNAKTFQIRRETVEHLIHRVEQAEAMVESTRVIVNSDNSAFHRVIMIKQVLRGGYGGPEGEEERGSQTE